MKTNIKTLGFLFALVTAAVFSPKHASAQQDYVSLQVFYDELSPYGDWVDYPKYGYVWIPDAGSDFVPYSTQGQWIFTDYGWTWVSDYEWGWAPFHYGRWDYDNYYGWLWVPDYEWGPSWVTWRSARGYYGWQPMRPGISISLSFGSDYNNKYNDYWMFVSDRDFQRSNVSNYYVNQTRRNRIIRNSTMINNTYIDNRRNTTYVSGPAREDVQRTTGRSVSPVVIRENNRPGQDLKNGQLQIYRPQVRNNNDMGKKPVPNRISNSEDVKRPSERNAVNQQRNPSSTNNGRQQQRQNAINQQNIDRGNSQREQQQKVNQSENNRQQRQRQNNINQQNIDRGNAQREQQQKVNQSENRKREQQQNEVTQPNNNNQPQPTQQQNAKPNDNNRQEQPAKEVTPPNKNSNRVQPAQQQKVNAPQNNVRGQKQINRQEKSNRNKQEKENKKRKE